MVKGVNKTIIEVNNTGSKVFDRIVFYVNPTCANLSPKHLNKAIQSFTFQFEERAATYKTIRQRRMIRRRFVIGAISALVMVVTTTVLLLVL